jgi:plasmid maintenance system killer protein
MLPGSRRAAYDALRHMTPLVIRRGDRVGQYSIRINDQWRICFRWSERGAHDVQIVDYHP